MRIRSVRVKNLKSVKDQTIELSPLTVIVGANSSGKSTLLQSLLALVQAARTGATGDAFPLNGDVVRLGRFDRAKRLGSADEEPMTLTATLTVPEPALQGRYLPMSRARAMAAPPAAEALGREYTVTWSIDLNGGFENEPGSAQVQALDVSVVSPEGIKTNLEASRDSRSEQLRSTSETQMSMSFSGGLSGGGEGTVRVAEAMLRSGLPSRLFELLPLTTLVDAWIDALAAMPRAMSAGRQRPPSPLADIADDAVRGLAEFTGIDDGVIDLGYLRYFVRQRAQRSPIWVKDQQPEDIRNAILERAVEIGLDLDGQALFAVSTVASETIEALSSETRDFFSNQVRHLEGLRSEPLAAMPLSPNARSGQIGSKGEYTAAVMRALGNTEVTACPIPPEVKVPPARVTLLRATQMWMKELGLLTTFQTTDLADQGHAVDVRLPGLATDLRMTAVGVGVSQSLPVIAACLLADPGETVLLEQPELHLHPKPQQRLADFLLECAKSGRQIVVETHSEHLINRLRYRIATDEADEVTNAAGTPIRDLVGIVFAERSEDTGETEYRQVAVNDYGGFDEWPNGFFDDGILELQRVVAAGLRKQFGLSPTEDVSVER